MAKLLPRVATPGEVMAATATTGGKVDPVAWSIDFLNAIGAPTTPTNINTVIAWGTAESGAASGGGQAHGGWSNFNPLNVVVQSNDAHVGQGGTQGNIADFGSQSAGVKASARLFLNNPNAAPIIASLRSASPLDQVNAAINRFYSTWGGSINLAGVTPSTAPGAAHTAQTTSVAGDVVNGLLGPVLGGASQIVGGPAKLAGVFIGLFSNWRYLAEVFIGGAMILLGVLLVLHDTGVTQVARQGATVAALA